jgi:diguanylate cyclase
LGQKINELTRQGFILAFIFIFVGAALTFLMARQITMPLSELANAASKMKNGDLNVRAKQRAVNDEISLLSTTFNEMADAIQERERALHEQAGGLEKAINERTAELQEQARVLEEMAITDPLTHAYNRRQFYKLAEIEMKRAEKNKQPLSVIVMDADNFKRINDRYGHQAGDQALVKLTEICQGVIRDTDLFARYGGEEFVVLMPNTDIHSAKQIAERIRQEIEEAKIETGTRKIQFTISLGVSTFFDHQDLTFDSLLTQADRALYVSKNMGRNRVTHWVEQTFQYN